MVWIDIYEAILMKVDIWGLIIPDKLKEHFEKMIITKYSKSVQKEADSVVHICCR